MTPSDKPLKCGKDPCGYWQLRSTGRVAVITGTCIGFSFLKVIWQINFSACKQSF